MNIGIFGGGFNPMHYGHLEMIEKVFFEKKIDKMIIVPDNESPFKKFNYTYAPRELRLEGIKIMLEESAYKDKIEIDTKYLFKKSITLTHKVIENYKKEYPGDNLVLIIGGDQFVDFHKWIFYKNILRQSDLLVLPRTQYKKTNKSIDDKKSNVEIMNCKISNISSTMIRRGSWKNNLPLESWKLFFKKNAFSESIIKEYVSASRLKHTKDVVYYITTLAIKNSLDVDACKRSAYFHDISKEWGIKKTKKYMSEYLFSYKNLPFPILHQYASADFIKRTYTEDNKDVLNSISCHTTGKKNMSTYEKVLYIADKINKGRKYKDIRFLRKLVNKNIEIGFLAVLKSSKKYFEDKKIELSKNQREMFEYYRI